MTKSEIMKTINWTEKEATLFLEAVERVQKKVAEQVQGYLAEYQIKNGVFINSQFNLNRALIAKTELNGILTEAGYYELVEDYVIRHDELIVDIKKLYKGTGISTLFTERDFGVLAKFKLDDLSAFAGAGEKAVEELANSIYESVLHESKFSEVVNRLRGVIIGTDVRGGSLKRYTETYANTSMSRFDRNLNFIISQNAGIERFMYTGPLDGLTRPFCEALVGQILSKKEIESLDNGMGLDVMTFGGGWNCRHRWIGVDENLIGELE